MTELKKRTIDTCTKEIDEDVDLYDNVIAAGNYGKRW